MSGRKRRRKSVSCNDAVFYYMLGVCVTVGAVTGFVLPFVDGVVDFLVVNISYFGIAIGMVAGLVFTLLAERVVRCGQVGSGMVVAALGVWA